MFFAGAFVCNISSQSSDTIQVTCKLFGELAKVNVILDCTSCTGSSTRYSILGDSPVVIPELSAGNYTAEIIAVNVDNDYADVKMFMMSDNVVTTTTNTPANGATDTTTNIPTNDVTDTTTITPANDATDTTTNTPSTESIPHT